MIIARWLSAIFILAVIILGLGFVKFGQIQSAIAFAESFPEPSASVKSTFPEKSMYSQTTKVIGQVQASQTLNVSNEYAGIITYVGFQPGDVVLKDQVLMTLDTSLEQANLDGAKAKLVLAKKTLERFESLVKQNRISQDEVDRAKADVSIAQAEVDNLTSVITKKTIRAPFAGRVSLEKYEVGQLLDINSQITSLVGIADFIWVNFSIPQTLHQLSIGDMVEVSLATDNQQVTRVPAKVIAKHSSLDVNSRQQGYRVELTNSDNTFIHNQIVNVYVPLSNNHVVMVPTNAITRSHFGDFVYQLVEDDKGNLRAKSIQVSLGDKIDNQQVILNGLNGDELIASEGAFKLKDQLLVYTQLPQDELASAGGK